MNEERDAKLAQMDEAAAEAKAEMQQNLEQWSAKDLIAWWARRYMTAGHKRLGRILVSLDKGGE